MRIALATVGTEGDVRPFVALAAALVGRGHTVTAITWPLHADAFAGSGARVEVAGPHDDPAAIRATAERATALRSPMAQVAVLRDFHLADGAAHARRLRDLVPGHHLAVVHTIHALAHAAVLDTGTRWASVAFDPVLLPTRSAAPAGMPNLGPLNRLAWRLLDAGLDRVGRPLGRVLRAAGSGQRRVPIFRARSPELHLLACSPAIAAVPDDVPAGTRVTGAWHAAPQPLPDDLAAFLADGSPPVTVTFGSMATPRPEVVAEALGRLLGDGFRIVVQGDLAPGLADPRLHRAGFVDHRALFAASATVVHHAGAGTAHAVAAAGVPSVPIPHIGDQHYWAERLHRLGVATRALPAAELRLDRLVDRVAKAHDHGPLHERARELAATLADEDGIGAAVAAIEGLG